MIKQKIPKKIWTYWHDKKLPLIVEKCIETWKICKDYKIIILNESNRTKYITRKIPKKYYDLKYNKRANWCRCAVIAENGGFWLDANIILIKPLKKWINHNVDFFGFRCPVKSCNNQIENWMFGAPAKSKLIKDWLEEYEKAIRIGDLEYCDYIKKNNIVNDKYHSMPYLFHQLCFMVIFKKYNNLKLHILSSYDTALAWHRNFDKENGKHHFDNSSDLYSLIIKNKQEMNSPVYKFMGFHRKSITTFIKNTNYCNQIQLLVS